MRSSVLAYLSSRVTVRMSLPLALHQLDPGAEPILDLRHAHAGTKLARRHRHRIALGPRLADQLVQIGDAQSEIAQPRLRGESRLARFRGRRLLEHQDAEDALAASEAAHRAEAGERHLAVGHEAQQVAIEGERL